MEIKTKIKYNFHFPTGKENHLMLHCGVENVGE